MEESQTRSAVKVAHIRLIRMATRPHRRMRRPPWASRRGRPPSWRQHEAAAEEIEVCAAKHLPFQHLEAVDMPLDRAIRPGQRHAGFDGRIVVLESGGKAAQGLLRTGRRALEPGIELRRLALAYQGRKILGEVDCLRNLGRLRVELGELLRLGLWALRRTPQHQPGRPARRERGTPARPRWGASGVVPDGGVGCPGLGGCG